MLFPPLRSRNESSGTVWIDIMHFLYRILSFFGLKQTTAHKHDSTPFWVKWSVSPLFGKLIYTPKRLLSTI